MNPDISRRKPFKFGKTIRLKEDPDTVHRTGQYYSTSDAYPFIIDAELKQIWIGKAGTTHGKIIDKTRRDKDNDKLFYYPEDDYTRKNSWHGRFWTAGKTISFWRIPTPEQARKIVDFMNQQVGPRFFNGQTMKF